MSEPTMNGQQWMPNYAAPTVDDPQAEHGAEDGRHSAPHQSPVDFSSGHRIIEHEVIEPGVLLPDPVEHDAAGHSAVESPREPEPLGIVLPAPIAPSTIFPHAEPEPEPAVDYALPPAPAAPTGWGTPSFLATVPPAAPTVQVDAPVAAVYDQEYGPATLVERATTPDVTPSTPEPQVTDFDDLFAQIPDYSTPRAVAPQVARVDGSDGGPVLPPAASLPGISLAERVDDDQGDVLDDYLRMLVKLNGSDLHLSPGSPPRIRIHGDLRPIEDAPVLTDDTLRRMIEATLMAPQKTQFEQTHELNFSYGIAGEGRFRGNLMLRDGSYAAVYRLIPWQIKTLGELKMPKVLADFAQLHRGLVLVTGATGSGKSTTLAAIIDLANRTRDGHILTIEDPVEFVHQHQRCVVNQREVGPDTTSFAEALRNALRQDPDIILVGEMRDLETIQVALSAAETGHLVFGTLHTSSAKDTINRIIDAFPANQQDQIRTQIASSLTAVLCQTLCRTIDGKGRAAATELMISDTAIRAAIRESKIEQIPNNILQGRALGMHTLSMSLADLVKADKIGAVEAAEKSYKPDEIAEALGLERGNPEVFARYQADQIRRIHARAGNAMSAFGR